MFLRFCSSIVLSTALLFSTDVFAHQLEHEMHVIGKSAMTFAKTNQLKVAKKQLSIMRKATVASKRYLPHKLEGRSAEDADVIAYQAGLDELIAEIDKVKALVEQGQLDQAKAEAIEFAEIRNKYHLLFK